MGGFDRLGVYVKTMRRHGPWLLRVLTVSLACSSGVAADKRASLPNVALARAAGVCGDGLVDVGEVCDVGPPLNLDGETCNALGFPGGTLRCAMDCLSFDTAQCIPVPVCGNGAIDLGEVCDGLLLNLQSCTTQGLGTGGSLTCLPDCSGFNTDACAPVAVPPDPCVFHTVRAPDRNTFQWLQAADIDMVRGPLARVRAYKINQLRRDFGVTEVDVSADNPAPGEGFYYLFKHLTTCPLPVMGSPGIPTWASQGQAFDRDDLLPDGGCNRLVPDVWTVNGDSQSYTALNGCTDQVKFSGSLLGAADASPKGIAFATVPGAPGDSAFITQGTSLQVIDTATGLMADQINVANLIGRPGICSVSGGNCSDDPECLGAPDICQPAVDLRGVATALPQTFQTPGPTERAFLYMAANVHITPADVRPWFIVLDQGPALDGAGGLTSLVQDGELQIPNPGGNAEALDVTVISTPNPSDPTEHQRAWFSARDVPTSQSFARLLATPASVVPANWTVRRTVITTNQTGPPSQFVQIGAGDRGELAVKPGGDTGQLFDLEVPMPDVVCSFGGTQVAVEIEGPATGGYTIYALDAQAELAWIIREPDVDGANCLAARSVPVGQSPTAIDALGQTFQVKAFVANGAGNTVTSFDKNGNQLTTTALPAADMTPVDIAVQQTPSRSCNVEDIQVWDARVTFAPVGCEPGEIFLAWCRCTDPSGVTCPPECPFDPSESCPGCEEVGDNPWEEIGVGEGTDIAMVPEGGSIEITVTSEKKEPVP